MSRYIVEPDWEDDIYDNEPYVTDDGMIIAVQSATLRDTQGRHTYPHGAYRIVMGKNGNLKPLKGKGGTVPFKGESAWSDAARLFRDTVIAYERAR